MSLFQKTSPCRRSVRTPRAPTVQDACPGAGGQRVGRGDMACRPWAGRQGVNSRSAKERRKVGQGRAVEPQGARGGPERPVAEQALAGAWVDTRCEPTGGKGVAQGMDALAVLAVGRPLLAWAESRCCRLPLCYGV